MDRPRPWLAAGLPIALRTGPMPRTGEVIVA
jgi:hypothetical protein